MAVHASLQNPVNGTIARQQLGYPGPPIGRTRFAAIKRAMGLTGRYVFVHQIQQWLAAHPNFSETQIYQRKRKPSVRQNTRKDLPVATGRMNGER